MKTKMTLLVVVTAIATLSFTYVATKSEKSSNQTTTVNNSKSEAVGGLVSEAN